MLRILSIVLASATGLLAHPHEDLPVEASHEAREALAKTKSFRLAEGLPHPAKESDLFSLEAERRDTRLITGFFFYKDERKTDPATTEQLRLIVSDSANLTEWEEKRCGGFHPDWALSWRRGLFRDHALICFSCHDIIYISGDYQLRYSLTPQAARRLKTILTPFHRNRPAPER